MELYVSGDAVIQGTINVTRARDITVSNLYLLGEAVTYANVSETPSISIDKFTEGIRFTSSVELPQDIAEIIKNTNGE